MRAGGRNTEIVIEHFASAGNDPVFNNPLPPDWQPFKTLWAAAEARKGREGFDQGGLYAQDTIRFTLDWMDGQGITEQMRVVCNGKTYDIKPPIDFDLDLKRHVMFEGVAGIKNFEG